MERVEKVKRFTETLKWGDPWFRNLKPEMKLLWQWLLDNCDAAGIIDPDLDLASFQIGYQYPMDTLSNLSGRVSRLPSGKWLIVKFIKFQYGDRLSRECRAHNPVFQSLKDHGVDFEMIGYAKGIDRVQDKVKVKDKVKEDVNGHLDELPTEKEAIARTMTAGIPEGFSKFVYQDWSSRAGKDASGVVVSFLPYVTKRWARESMEWRNGKHKGLENRERPVGGNF